MYYKRKSTEEIVIIFIKNKSNSNSCTDLNFLDCTNCPFKDLGMFCKRVLGPKYKSEERYKLVIDYYIKNIGTIETLFEVLL